MAAHERYSRVGPYILMETLGVGAFGKVKLAVHSVTYQRFACKILDKSLIRERVQSVQVYKEIDIMQRLSHENIVKLVNVYSTTARIFIIMELVTGGELFEEIVRLKRLPEPYARFYFRQLINGVQHCHEQGVYHRDLKPENLLLGENRILKITDFGMSTLKAGGQSTTASVTGSLTLHTQCGTPNYVAPEIITLDPKGYKGPQVDAWACGVILYVLVAGALPFDAPQIEALFDMILHARLTYPPHFSDDLIDLISNMLKTNPSERFTLADVKQHPWFNGPVQDHIDDIPSPVPSPVPSNPASTPPIESPQPVQPDNVHEEVSMASRMHQPYEPSPLSQYAFQGAGSQSAQRPAVRMPTTDSLDFGIRAESAEADIMFPPSFPQPVVSPSPVLPAAISDNGLQSVDDDGDPHANNSANSDCHTDPSIPSEVQNHHADPLERFRSHVLGDSVPSSDDDNEFEEAQELRAPPGLRGPRDVGGDNGAVSPGPIVRRACSLDNLNRYALPVLKGVSDDNNFAQEEYGIAHPGIRGLVKRQLWDRAAQAWRIPPQSCHFGNPSKSEDSSGNTELNQDQFHQSTEPESRHVQGEKRNGLQFSSKEQYFPSARSLDQSRQSLNHALVSRKESRDQFEESLDRLPRKSFTSADEQSQLSIQNAMVTSEYLEASRRIAESNIDLGKHAISAAQRMKSLNTFDELNRTEKSDNNPAKYNSSLKRSLSHDGRFTEQYIFPAGSRHDNMTSFSNRSDDLQDAQSRAQRTGSGQSYHSKRYRGRRKRKPLARKQVVEDRPPSRSQSALLRFQGTQQEQNEAQHPFGPSSYWVENEARKMGWCKMMRDYDMIPDEDEFGMSSAALNDLWREGLAKENFIKEDINPSSCCGQGLYKLSRSSQYLSYHANKSKVKGSTHSRRQTGSGDLDKLRRTSPSEGRSSRSSSPGSVKEECKTVESTGDQQDRRHTTVTEDELPTERKNEELLSTHGPPANVNSPIMACSLTSHGRSSPSPHSPQQEDEGMRSPNRKLLRQVSFAADNSIRNIDESSMQAPLDRSNSPNVKCRRTGATGNPRDFNEKAGVHDPPTETHGELNPSVPSDLVAAQRVHFRCTEASPGRTPDSRDKRERSPPPTDVHSSDQEPLANGPLSAVPARLFRTATSESSFSEGSTTHSSSSLPGKHDVRSSMEKQQNKHQDSVSDMRSSDMRPGSSDRGTRSIPIDSSSSSAITSAGSDGFISTSEDPETVFGHAEAESNGHFQSPSRVSWQDDEDRVEENRTSNVPRSTCLDALYEMQGAHNPTEISSTLKSTKHEKPVNPFLLDIPGPKDKRLPRRKPWSGIISSHSIPRKLQIRPLSSYGVKPLTQFHTRLQPERCFEVMKELMVEYGCPTVKPIVLKEKQKFKIYCESTKEGARASAVVLIYESHNLSVVHMRKKANGDSDEFVEFYSQLYRMYSKHAKLEYNKQDGRRPRGRRAGLQEETQTRFGETVSSSTEDRTATSTSIRSAHGSTLPMESVASSDQDRLR